MSASFISRLHHSNSTTHCPVTPDLVVANGDKAQWGNEVETVLRWLVLHTLMACNVVFLIMKLLHMSIFKSTTSEYVRFGHSQAESRPVGSHSKANLLVGQRGSARYARKRRCVIWLIPTVTTSSRTVKFFHYGQKPADITSVQATAS